MLYYILLDVMIYIRCRYISEYYFTCSIFPIIYIFIYTFIMYNVYNYNK